MQSGYVPTCKILSPREFGGCQNRSRLFFVCVRDDMYAAMGEFWFPEVTTPAQDVTIRKFLDHHDDVDWNRLEVFHEYESRNAPHLQSYDGPRRDLQCRGGIGGGSFSIDDPACTLKWYDANEGGWSQVYHDDRGEHVGHRRLSEDEGCRMSGVRKRSSPQQTRKMLGGGIDGHVLRPLVSSMEKFVSGYKRTVSEPVGAPLAFPVHMQGPKQLNHGRFACPGSQQSALMGWSQLEDFFCDICPQAKMKHARRSTKPVPKLQRVGVLVGGDIIGKVSPTSQNKYTYAAVFVDAWSRKVFTYPLRHKDEFTAAFEHLMTVFRANDTPITTFITDTDSVMTSRKFCDVAVSNNVELRLSSPYCHWQNGLVERYIGTLKNKTIANLLRAGLGPEWWWAAWSHAAESWGATPHPKNVAMESPNNVFAGRVHHTEVSGWVCTEPLDESFRRTFGAEAYVRREHRKRFEPKADKCMFVGYAPRHADGVYDFYNYRTHR